LVVENLRSAGAVRLHADRPTAASDLSRATLAALEFRDGLQFFTISGARALGLWSTDRARDLLGWQPIKGL